MSKVYQQTTVEFDDGGVKELNILSTDIVFQSPNLRPNPFHAQGQGPAFYAPALVGIKNKYSYVGSDNKRYEAEYADPRHVRKDRRTGEEVNQTMLEMRDGMLIIPSNNPGLYEFLHFHPENGNNPVRDSGYPVSFLEITPPEDPKAVQERKENAFQAKARIAQLNEEALFGLAQKMGVSTSQDVYQIKEALYAMADESPGQFLEFEPTTSTKGLIEEALVQKVIQFAGRHKTFSWNTDFGDEDRLILQTETGKDLGLLVETFDKSPELLQKLKERV